MLNGCDGWYVINNKMGIGHEGAGWNTPSPAPARSSGSKNIYLMNKLFKRFFTTFLREGLGSRIPVRIFTG